MADKKTPNNQQPTLYVNDDNSQTWFQHHCGAVLGISKTENLNSATKNRCWSTGLATGIVFIATLGLIHENYQIVLPLRMPTDLYEQLVGDDVIPLGSASIGLSTESRTGILSLSDSHDISSMPQIVASSSDAEFTQSKPATKNNPQELESYAAVKAKRSKSEHKKLKESHQTINTTRRDAPLDGSGKAPQAELENEYRKPQPVTEKIMPAKTGRILKEIRQEFFGRKQAFTENDIYKNGQLTANDNSGLVDRANIDKLKLDSDTLTILKQRQRHTKQFGKSVAAKSIDPSYLTQESIAQNYITTLNDTNNLTFKDATGYWANTYIPGDPEIRSLQSRLTQWDRQHIAIIVGSDGQMENLISQNILPFDPPNNAALAVYLQSDKNSVQGPTRMRLQVGLQATERHSGQRPAMNVAIIVDVQSKTNNQLAPKIKALLRALAEAKQPGDRFSLVVSGINGGVWIQPEQFRHGHIQVAINKLFNRETQTTATIDLPKALNLATDIVQQHNDPTAVFGSSMTLLISSSDLTNSIDTLETKAHRNALSGITMSVFPLGKIIKLSDVDQLVLSGQGQRRILLSPRDAESLVNKELLSSSRAVARAVRLRIRLGKDVKLVNILDSHRLDELNTERVRQAEQSIDKRLSRNFGITSDRGEDEEGIQIVIPNFFAGDSHVVMLDVVASNPGAIADVTVRYKDLLYLNNGVARNNLNIVNGNNKPGPLQLNVSKNLLAIKLAQAVRSASTNITLGNFNLASNELIQLRDLYQGMRQQITAWHNDHEILNDEQLLTQYISILSSPNISKELPLVAASMRLAGYRKLFNSN